MDTTFQLPSIPTALCSFSCDYIKENHPTIAVAVGTTIFMYRDRNPYIKMVLPMIEPNQIEKKIWKDAIDKINTINNTKEDTNNNSRNISSNKSKKINNSLNVSQIINMKDNNAKSSSIYKIKSSLSKNKIKEFIISESNTAQSSPYTDQLLKTSDIKNEESNEQIQRNETLDNIKNNGSPENNNDDEEQKKNDLIKRNEKLISDVVSELVKQLIEIRDAGVIELSPTTIQFLAIEDLDSKVAYVVANLDINLSIEV